MKTRLVSRLFISLCLGLFWAGATALLSLFVKGAERAVPYVFAITGAITMFGLCITCGCEEAEG